MSRKGGLGRGLSALIGTPVPVAPEPVQIKAVPANIDSPSKTANYLKIQEISANPTQPRYTFTDQELRELTDSIKTYGVLQPILVRPTSSGYQIVAGERRFRAAKEANLTEVPVVIKELTDKETLEIALIENVQRQGLNPIEEAKGYQRLSDEFGLSAQEIAERVGKERATIANTLRLLKLPEVVSSMLEKGEITTGHAKAILTVKEPQAMIGLAQKVKNEGLSVRALEAIVSRSIEIPARRELNEKGGAQTKNVSTHPEIEDRLRLKLGTKVIVKEESDGSGKVVIHYHSASEFARIIELIDA